MRKIATADIHEVKIGVDSSQVLFSNKVDEYLDNKVFSIHSTKRTLDLRAPEEAIRNRWVKYLNNLINQHHCKMKFRMSNLVVDPTNPQQKIHTIPLRYLRYLAKW